MSKIQRALISVSDKSGLVHFAQYLHKMGVELVSTGGTSKDIKSAGIPVRDISEFTGVPEMLNGRVKTLVHTVFGGILYIRGNEQDEATVTRLGILPIDLVVVNLYPFAQTVANPDCALADAIEKIDIGGPSLLRAAAKNHISVTVVVNPARYQTVLGEMSANDGATTLELRRELALEVFRHTAGYDTAIAGYLQQKGF